MHKWTKKVGLSLMIGAGFFLVAACGNSSEKSDAKGETLKVGVWGGNPSEEKSLDTLIANFEKETGAKVEKKVYTDYNTQIQADLVGKTAPDVFYVDASMYPFFAEQGALMELDKDKIEADKFYDKLNDAFSTDGKQYAVPKDLSTLALYLNTDIFEKAGVSLDEIPASFEEYVQWLPQFQAKIDAAYGEGKVFAMSYNPELTRNMHIAQRNSTRVIAKDGLAELSNQKVLTNLSILPELVKTNAFVTPQDVGTGWNGEAFGAGKIAIMDEGNWVYQTLQDDYADINFEVKPMPTYKQEKGSMMFSVGWAKYAGTKQSDLADKWIHYTTGKDGMQLWVEGTGTLPSRQDVAEAAKITDNPALNVHLDAWEYATVWQDGVTLTTVDSAYKNFIPKALDGSTSLEEAMKKADEQANTDIEAGK
ncbi:ABC transporter substrate-binding protein [Carnobacterium maltaromaticum]|uniref:ABC transporter substrate-binding protein n=1 Tax=Carnobacterium maltaromaticum TaxID=2751 RepID=UPI00295EE96C|nr:extracellular solute-binding protein [Carnobacterium maltaromaticum]